MQGNLDPDLAPVAKQAGRDNAGIVADKHITGAQQSGQVRDGAIRRSGCGKVKQARGFPGDCRGLRNQLLGQLKVKDIDQHDPIRR